MRLAAPVSGWMFLGCVSLLPLARGRSEASPGVQKVPHWRPGQPPRSLPGHPSPLGSLKFPWVGEAVPQEGFRRACGWTWRCVNPPGCVVALSALPEGVLQACTSPTALTSLVPPFPLVKYVLILPSTVKQSHVISHLTEDKTLEDQQLLVPPSVPFGQLMGGCGFSGAEKGALVMGQEG